MKKPKKSLRLKLKIEEDEINEHKGLNIEKKNYTTIWELGVGSFGTVFLVLHNEIKKKIAIKSIITRNEDESIQKLISEVWIHFWCDNDNIVKCLGY